MGNVNSFRDIMADALYDVAKADERIIVVAPDLGRAVRIERYMEDFPDRYVSVGISEANMTGVAAGLATLGFIPVIVGFAMFVAEKPFEQIRNSIAYPNLNVKIIATHGGICVGRDGATHQALEDLAIMRTMPHFSVLAAGDALQTREAIAAIVRHQGPVYLRLGRDKAQQLYREKPVVTIGGSDVMREGKDIAILATGTILPYAVEAAGQLADEGIDAAVVNMYSLKPIDTQRILELADRYRCLVTVEDHFLVGGLRGAVAEVVTAHQPVPVESVGVDDTFGESGTESQLYEKYGLSVAAIKQAAKRAMARQPG